MSFLIDIILVGPIILVESGCSTFLGFIINLSKVHDYGFVDEPFVLKRSLQMTHLNLRLFS